MGVSSILIVEDEFVIAKDIEISLKNMGYIVCAIVSSGEEAITKAEKEKPDLVLMDIILKGAMDGIEAAMQIRSLFSIPTVYLTAYADEATIGRAKLSEPFGYILKPFNDIELNTTIEIALYKHKIKKKLQESEGKSKRYLEAIDSMGLGIFIVDSDYHIRHMNKTMIKWFGDHIGSNCHQSINGLTSPCTYCKLKPVIESNKIVHYTPTIPDGRSFDIMCYPIQNSDGSISKMEIIRDITEHKKIEKALRYSEGKFRSLVEVTSDWIWEVNAKGIYTYVSPMVEEILGYTPKEIVGKTPFDLMPPDEAGKIEGIFKNLVKTGKPITAMENVCLHKDGRLIVLETNGVQILDAAGKISGYRGVDRDITKRKRAQEEVVRMAKEWQLTFDTTNDAIWLLDKDQRIRRSNKKADQLFQRSGMNIIGKHCWEIAHGTKKPISECPNLRARLSLKRETMELKIGKGWFQVNVDPILDAQGQYAGVVHIITDITNLKEAQKIKLQASRMESISTLTGGIAHDFNNLLSVIMGNIELAETQMSPDNEGLNFLSSAKKASMQASELTRQLITFSKGGAPIKKLGSITDLLKEVANTVLTDSNAICKFELPTELWPVEFDKKQMIHAINNLIDNAVESMPDGGTIIVKAENFIVTAKQRLPITIGKYIKLSIRDRGVGIVKEHLPLVFDPYFSTKEMGNKKGTGLGLTTTYSIIIRHDGYITVESDPGIGSCFTIYLSAYEKMVGVIEPQRIPKPEKESVKTGKILLMDDEKMMRHLGKEMLNALEYEAHLVENGSEAIKSYQHAMDTGKPFDAVILDLTIKNGMGGKETVKKIIEIDPYVKSIVSSGYSNDPVMTDHKKYGFVGILPKPYNVEKLDEELNKVTKE